MALITGEVGAGQTYADLAAWYASVPNPVAGTGNIYQANIHGALTGTGTLLDASATATSATEYIILAAAVGQKFSGTPLAFNAANGASISSSTGGVTLALTNDMRVIGLQIQNTGGGQGAITTSSGSTGNPLILDSCILNQTGGGFYGCLSLAGSCGVIATNCLLQVSGGGAVRVMETQTANAIQLIYCTLAATTDAGTKPTVAINYDATPPSTTITDCGIFGCTGLIGGSPGTLTYVTSMTDLTGTTGLTGGQSYSTSQFVGITNAAADWTPKSGTTNLAAGSVNAVTVDIVGTTRSGSTPTIGAREVVAAAAPVSPIPIRRRVTRWVDRPIVVRR